MLSRHLITGCVAALLIAALIAPMADAAKGGNGGGGGKPGGGGGGDPAIAYVSWQSKSGALEDVLMVMDADGSDQTVVYKEKAPRGQIGYAIGRPSWSPDGTKIAFARYYAGGIFTIGVDGSGLTQVTNAGTEAAWSPDGTEIAYTKSNDIYVVDADGTNDRQLTSTGAVESSPTWSPDGSEIAYAFHRPSIDQYDVLVHDVATNAVTNVTAASGLDAGGAIDWARTQDKIAFTVGLDGPAGVKTDVFIVDLSDPTNPVNLTGSAEENEISPSWSPDDAHLTFHGRGGGIWTIGADGTGATLLAETSPGKKWTWAGLRNPDWRR